MVSLLVTCMYAINVDFTEIFWIVRLFDCTLFAMVMFSDYFSAILCLVHWGSNWSLAPFGEYHEQDHKPFEHGRGNVCSIEVCSLN